MHFQFIHIDHAPSARRRDRRKRRSAAHPAGAHLSRGWSAADLLREAARMPGHCPHVTNPAAPTVLYGVAPLDVLPLIDDWLAARREKVRHPHTGKPVAYRKDSPVLACGVFSLPSERADDWDKFKVATITWLRQRYGERLKCVVEHRDETHPHAHFYLVPRPDEDFSAVHDGWAAQTARRRACAAANQSNGIHARMHYIAAMRLFQDEYHRDVAQHFLLQRVGDRRRRMQYREYLELVRRSEAEAAARQAEQRKKRAEHDTEEVRRRTSEWLEQRRRAALKCELQLREQFHARESALASREAQLHAEQTTFREEQRKWLAHQHIEQERVRNMQQKAHLLFRAIDGDSIATHSVSRQLRLAEQELNVSRKEVATLAAHQAELVQARDAAIGELDLQRQRLDLLWPLAADAIRQLRAHTASFPTPSGLDAVQHVERRYNRIMQMTIKSRAHGIA